jgi:hypothetical protein
MATQEIAPRPMQLGDATLTDSSVHHAGTDEKGPHAAKPAGQADDANALGHVLPLAAADAHAIGEMQPVVISAEIDRGDLLAVAAPLPAAHPAGAQAALAVQPVHIDRTAGFDLVAPASARPSRSEAAHHALRFFPKSFGNPGGDLIPIASRAATASALRAACQAAQQRECSQAWPVLSTP